MKGSQHVGHTTRSEGTGLDAEQLGYSVAASYVNGLLGVATSLLLDRAELLALVQLDEDILATPSNRIVLDDFLRLATIIESSTNRQDIGLFMAEQALPGTFSALGYAAMSCDNLEEAALLIPRYEDVVLNAGVTQFLVNDGVASISWKAKTSDVAIRVLHDVVVAGWYCFAKWVTTLNQYSPMRVRFSHKRPADITHYQELFQCPLEFEAPVNEIIFDAQFLKVPLPQVDRELHQLMKQKADSLLSGLALSDSLHQQVVNVLRHCLPKHEANIVTVANTLNISERTLRRHLSDEGFTFAQVLVDVRSRLSMLYLKNSDLSILDVALLLGYSNQSAFTSAFKTWNEITPSLWRKQENDKIT